MGDFLELSEVAHLAHVHSRCGSLLTLSCTGHVSVYMQRRRWFALSGKHKIVRCEKDAEFLLGNVIQRMTQLTSVSLFDERYVFFPLLSAHILDVLGSSRSSKLRVLRIPLSRQVPVDRALHAVRQCPVLHTLEFFGTGVIGSTPLLDLVLPNLHSLRLTFHQSIVGDDLRDYYSSLERLLKCVPNVRRLELSLHEESLPTTLGCLPCLIELTCAFCVCGFLNVDMFAQGTKLRKLALTDVDVSHSTRVCPTIEELSLNVYPDRSLVNLFPNVRQLSLNGHKMLQLSMASHLAFPAVDILELDFCSYGPTLRFGPAGVEALSAESSALLIDELCVWTRLQRARFRVYDCARTLLAQIRQLHVRRPGMELETQVIKTPRAT